MTTSEKDAVKLGKPFRKSDVSVRIKSLAGSDFMPSKRSVAERVAEAFAVASRKTGAFESRYAKK